VCANCAWSLDQQQAREQKNAKIAALVILGIVVGFIVLLLIVGAVSGPHRDPLERGRSPAVNFPAR
jgi:ABC-type lipoprotein release transport system permease subunit